MQGCKHARAVIALARRCVSVLIRRPQCPATARPPRAHGWILGTQHRTTAPAIRLFCLPYAGGAASAYAQWSPFFGDEVEVCGIELPGRQSRWSDRPFTRMEPLIDALASAIESELDVPYALFGHSMGSLVAFELARELRRRGAAEPHVLFASAGPAPQLRRPESQVHDQPDAVVIDRLRSLGGLPEEIYAEPELLELLLPTIRADFEVLETYAYRSGLRSRAPSCRLPEPETKRCRSHALRGDHFFLRSAQAQLLETVRAALAATCPPEVWRRGLEAGRPPS
ncbi:thioesterase II family protein [Streptomyces sp. NPDC056437]|uniref:thioesterase II family protein n=1 Tax=Streptomyces sp. NPDC056437 TaxID=3345816 RepID=UPI0036D0575E